MKDDVYRVLKLYWLKIKPINTKWKSMVKIDQKMNLFGYSVSINCFTAGQKLKLKQLRNCSHPSTSDNPFQRLVDVLSSAPICGSPQPRALTQPELEKVATNCLQMPLLPN